MSKVYEALKKAEREGRWRESQPISSRPLEESAASSGVIPSDPGGRRFSVTPDAKAVDDGLLLFEAANGEARSPVVGKDSRGLEEAPSGLGLAGMPSKSQRWRELLRMIFRGVASGATFPPALVVGKQVFAKAGEQFQLLRTVVENKAAQHGSRVIMITSALSSEGKSFVSLNLAVTLASEQSPVLLIDGDLRTPTVHRVLNLAPLAGLLGYLRGEAQFEQCLCNTPIPGLTIVAAGGTTLSGPEFLAGPAMREFLRRARELTPPQLILIDMPAALSAPETQILVRDVDAAILVLAANHTPRSAFAKLLEIVDPLPIYGTVLNRFEHSYSEARHLRYSEARYENGNDA